MQFRLEHEYSAPCRLERFPYRYPRWITGTPEAIERFTQERGRMRLYDAKGNTLVLFESEWNLQWALRNESNITFHDVAP
jgi:peptide subunit release factor RF-3